MNNVSIEQLSIVLTYKCNLKCSYCFVSKRNETTTISKEIMHKAIQMWLKYFSIEKKSLKLLFTGGEPLLLKELLLVFIEESKLVYKNINIEYHITTNGLLLTELFLDEVKNRNIYICVSIDGMLDSNKERLGSNNYKKFDFLKKIIQMYACSLNKEKFRVRMTITPQNANKLSENIIFLIGIGVKNIHFAPNYEAKWDKANITTFFGEYGKLSELVKQDVIIEPFKTFSNNGVRKNGPYEHDCSFLPTIDTSGNVYYCPRFSGKKDSILGNVENPFEVLLNFRKIVRKFNNIYSNENLNFLCSSNFMENPNLKNTFKIFYEGFKQQK